MNNKFKKSTIFVILIILILVLDVVFVKLKKYNSRDYDNTIKHIEEDNKENEEIEKYNEGKMFEEISITFQKLEEVYSNMSENEKVVIISKNQNEISITEQELECYKILNENVANPEEKLTEMTILSEEAKYRELKLEPDVIERLEESKEALKKYDEHIMLYFEKYLDNVEYSSKLKNQILNEISNNELYMQDEELQTIIDDYQKLQDEAQNIENEEEKLKHFQKIYKKLNEFEELYIKKITEQYEIEIKD